MKLSKIKPLEARLGCVASCDLFAAMMRSFECAAVTAIGHPAESRPAFALRTAEAWCERTVNGYRAAFRKSMQDRFAYSATKSESREPIALCSLERAVRELSYELANQPDWAVIPFKGNLEIRANKRSPTQ